MTTTTLMTARPTTRIRSSVRAFTFRSSWATEQTEISTQKRDLPIYPSAPEPKSPVVRSNGPSTLENPNLPFTPILLRVLKPVACSSSCRQSTRVRSVHWVPLSLCAIPISATKASTYDISPLIVPLLPYSRHKNPTLEDLYLHWQEPSNIKRGSGSAMVAAR